MDQRPSPVSIPDAPGSYQFYDREGRVLYVGKAKSLRHRLTSYFQDPANLSYRTAQMVEAASRVEWVVVASEIDALMLEHSLIQTHQPRYNVRLKDDKTYPWLALTVSDEWPRPMVFRGKQKKGVQYFGPYPHVGALRSTIDLMAKSFPVRTCTDFKFSRHQRLRRPCLLYDIGRCSGPCIGAVDRQTYQGYVDAFVTFFRGDIEPMVGALTETMVAAADRLDFEKAARVRDQLRSVTEAAESQEVVLDPSADVDVIGLSEDELEAAFQIFHIRRGRVVGRHGLIVDKVEEATTESLIATVIERFYETPSTKPARQVLVPVDLGDASVLEAWLSARRGSQVTIAAPRRGRRRQLVELATRNAQEEFRRHRLRRAGDHNARAKALTELQQALSLATAPLRIECYDMSHLQGTDYVGSMVVFEDGVAKKSDYRHFMIKTVDGNNDYAAMAEVLRRRLRRLADTGVDRDPDEVGPKRFSYTPQLILIDGGKGQLAEGVAALEELGLTGTIELASLAKQFEEIYRPGSSEPIRLERGSDALYLLQRLRDEAHRFAITFHRKRRGQRMTASALDGIAGLGPGRRARLVAELGSVGEVKLATRDQLRSLSWLPDAVADAVFDALHGGPPAPRGDGHRTGQD